MKCFGKREFKFVTKKHSDINMLNCIRNTLEKY